VRPDEAQDLQIEGRYSELLRAAVREQVAARAAGAGAVELEWTLWAAKACRFLGRTYEGMAHAVHAALLAGGLRRPDLMADSLYVQALLFKGSHQPAGALGLLDQAVAVMPADTADFKRAVLDLDRAELCLEAGRPPEARAALARGAARVHWLENTRLLAWTLYLRSHFETAAVASGLLVGALGIAEGLRCPELEWQILWKLAAGMSRVGKPDAEEDYARRALGILRGMASIVTPDDAAAFWRQGARGEFTEYFSRRFPPSLGEPAPSAAPPVDRDEVPWDPAVLPSFVHESLQRAG
jgi:hypothetical protein